MSEKKQLQKLTRMVERTWQVEALPGDADQAMSNEDHYAMNKLKSEFKQGSDVRLQLPILWRPGQPSMPGGERRVRQNGSSASGSSEKVV
jgi:hypothetical protein